MIIESYNGSDGESIEIEGPQDLVEFLDRFHSRMMDRVNDSEDDAMDSLRCATLVSGFVTKAEEEGFGELP